MQYGADVVSIDFDQTQWIQEPEQKSNKFNGCERTPGNFWKDIFIGWSSTVTEIRHFILITCEEVSWHQLTTTTRRYTHSARGDFLRLRDPASTELKSRAAERKDDILRTVKLKSCGIPQENFASTAKLRPCPEDQQMDCWVRVNLGTNRHGIHPRHSEYT